MSEESTLKKIGTVFGDFKCDSNILNAKIEKVNLYKAKNSFEVFLQSDKSVNIKEVQQFEKFLSKRFMLTSATVKVKYNTEDDYSSALRSEWNNIVDYLAYKFPMTRAILRNSDVEIDNSNIEVKLHMSGKDYLKARGIDKAFEDTIENVYNKKFKVDFTELMTNEEVEKQRAFTKSLEEEAMAELSKQMEAEKIERAQNAGAETRAGIEGSNQDKYTQKSER